MWDRGAYEYGSIVTIPSPVILPPSIEPDVYVKLRTGGKLNKVKVTRRKGNTSDTVLITINKSTVLKVE